MPAGAQGVPFLKKDEDLGQVGAGIKFSQVEISNQI